MVTCDPPNITEQKIHAKICYSATLYFLGIISIPCSRGEFSLRVLICTNCANYKAPKLKSMRSLKQRGRKGEVAYHIFSFEKAIFFFKKTFLK